jgi:hypothetical protein
MKHLWVIWFIGGFMLGAVCVGAWLSSGEFTLPESLAFPVAPTSSGSIKHTSSVSGAVSIADQSAGRTVIVESVTVPPPGVWIAVREVNGDALGNVLGAVRVSGPRSNLSVPLLRATLPNSSYAVELYRDDGGNTFDLSSDSVYVDFTSGSPVISYFSTTK